MPPIPAAASPAESGAAQGRLLPGADDPTWETVPLYLRQQLRGPAHQLVSLAQGPLKARENRLLLSRGTGGQPDADDRRPPDPVTHHRESFGRPNSQRAQRLYAVVEQVAAQHSVPAEDQSAGRRFAMLSDPFATFIETGHQPTIPVLP
ncbi:hypothetical protein ACFUIV_22205 [Streptomyces anulatus]|uniref:hypothetical protein n=1 Tax=Streptomyces anulatus TaxID=1892 RepID=UPI00363E46B7